MLRVNIVAYEEPYDPLCKIDTRHIIKSRDSTYNMDMCITVCASMIIIVHVLIT